MKKKNTKASSCAPDVELPGTTNNTIAKAAPKPVDAREKSTSDEADASGFGKWKVTLITEHCGHDSAKLRTWRDVKYWFGIGMGVQLLSNR